MAVSAAELGPCYKAVDDIPELAIERSKIRQDALSILENRRQFIINGFEDNVPLPVDALSTARRVVEAQKLHGEDSAEYIEAKEGLRLDCSRLIAEWRRKNTYEYFPPVKHTFDPVSEEYYSHGASVYAMTEAALSPLAHAEEVDRRVNERVEEGTSIFLRKRIGSLALGETVRMRTVSECPDWAIDAFRSGKEGGYGGYVPQIEKLMIRDLIHGHNTNDRFEEAVSLPGTYINRYVMTEALRRRGVREEHLAKDKTELHGTQTIAEDKLFDFVALLDQVASEEWSTEIFMGEELPPGRVRDYAAVRREAHERQQQLSKRADLIALFVLDLQEQSTEGNRAVELVEEFVKNILINMADQNISLTMEMFDEKTEIGLREVADLRAKGLINEALGQLSKVTAEAPGGGYCGAGSCGLERVTPGSAEEKAIKKLGFNAKDTLIDKGDRKCAKCKSKTVVYDTKKAEKGCTNCSATAKY